MSLCLSCGLCCDGTMFREVPVTAAEAKALGRRALFNRTKTRMKQPCRALTDRCCQVYEDRPAKCREFNCLVLQGLLRGEVSEAEARQSIDDVLGRRARVAELMELPDDPVTAVERARALVAKGKAPLALQDAAERLERALLLMKADADMFG
ncbi:MAG: YkgJ family cysteine cluster protein [Myxococcaceae bacterium]|nr:YkgJ family cysteine cluster protein [Myxococcaceae bacterium]